MPYLTRRSETDCIAQYKRIKGREPTWLGKLFGRASHELFYEQMEAWSTLIDFVIPDQWYCKWAQDFLITIVKKVYHGVSVTAYYWGANEGDEIIGEIDDVIADTRRKIKNAISDARTLIERELINPLKTKINTELEPKVRDLLSRINSAETTIKDAENRINEALTDVSNLKNNVASLNTQANDLRAKIDDATRDFNIQITDLNNRLTTAKTYVDEHTKDIKELFERLKKVEQKVGEQTDLLAWLKSVIPT